MKLEVSNLKKSYGGKVVLDNIDFSFESGKIYGLLGRNGAGKTTFFNSLNSDIDIDSGTFYLEDEYGKNSLSTNDIGYVVSTPIVPEFLTAREFLEFFMEINKDKIDKDKTVDDYFSLVKISKEDQDKLLKDYSHGMKNKMQILINVIAHPKVILLDELGVVNELSLYPKSVESLFHGFESTESSPSAQDNMKKALKFLDSIINNE